MQDFLSREDYFYKIKLTKKENDYDLELKKYRERIILTEVLPLSFYPFDPRIPGFIPSYTLTIRCPYHLSNPTIEIFIKLVPTSDWVFGANQLFSKNQKE